MLAAAAAMAGAATTQAADLGGNCCADLEERVAELEATTARKGNGKVSLEISGHVNELVMYWDDGVDGALYILTNDQSPTRFRFKGNAEINADWSAGFLIEIGLRQTGNSGGADQTTLASTVPDIRHQVLYVKSKTLGTLHLGFTDDLTEAISGICLGCGLGDYPNGTTDILGEFQLRHDADDFSRVFDTVRISVGDVIGDFGGGARKSVVKYTTPTFAGFSLSAYWSDAPANVDDEWGAALRYSGEVGAARIAAGVGYADEGEGNGRAIAAGSIQHIPTGLFVGGSWGQREAGLTDATDEHWSVHGGVAAKWSPLGRTRIAGRYGSYQTDLDLADTTGVYFCCCDWLPCNDIRRRFKRLSCMDNQCHARY